jgi:AcrR family transcriptional regulator
VNISCNANGVNICAAEIVNSVNIRQDGQVTSARSAPRDSYHHGNLTQALTEAATSLARTGGPEAVVLREAARKVGVSATAAYRHFDRHSDLKEAVKLECQAQLRGRMQAAVAAVDPLPDPAAEAVRKLRAIGQGYLEFARAEPGLYRTAFCRIERDDHGSHLEMLDAPAYVLLSDILDEMVASGAMPAHRRPLAEIATWSMAHGLAMLIVDGPLSYFDEEVLQQTVESSLATLVDGLRAP